MPGREVITLQFGNFANYVGAHYWNFQDELLGLQQQQEGERGPASQIDSDVLYRQGQTLHGEGTYTPRLVLWDLSGALGGISAQGTLYRESTQLRAGGIVSTWAGRQQVHRAPPVARSRFAVELDVEAEAEEEQYRQAEGGWESRGGAAAAGAAATAAAAGPSGRLEEAAQQLDSEHSRGSGGVHFFTDYLKAHLHPRSVHQLQGAWHELTPFGGWGDGGEHWRSEEQREEMMERIRFFAEESDGLQGFQCFAEDLTGWGQLTAHVLQEVQDKYGTSLPIMLYALRPQAAAPAPDLDPAEARRWQLAQGLSLSHLAPLCSTYTVVAPPSVPAALPLLRWRPGSAYHASALCGAALDTATLPYRLVAGEGPNAPIGQTDMWGLSQLLSAQHSTPLTALAVALPCAPLPPDVQRRAHQLDARLKHSSAAGAAAATAVASAGRAGAGGGSGSSSGTREGHSGPFTSQWLASLTPGIAATGDEKRYAESVVLRGPRAAGADVELRVAAEELDGALLQERLRCVQQCTLVAQPLAVPLPYPRIFARSLSHAGDPAPSGAISSHGSDGSRDIASCAVLSRLHGTAAFGAVVAAAQRQFHAAAGSVQGQATLESWGHGREEVQEAQEQLSRLAHAYDREELY